MIFTKFNQQWSTISTILVTFVNLTRKEPNHKHPLEMINKNVDYALFPQCPIRNVLSRIGDKWSMLVLFTLEKYGVLRFNELKLYIPDISKKMLSTALKVLEADGLVARKMYAEIPPRVEYRLTERGLTLIPLINKLIDWAAANMEDIMADRNKYLMHNS